MNKTSSKLCCEALQQGGNKGIFTTLVFNMAAGIDEDVCIVLQQEFKAWQENTGNDYIFLLEVSRTVYVIDA